MSGPWEDFQTQTAPTNNGGPWNDFAPPEPVQGKPQDLASKIYTPIIEGGAMTVGGAAGAVMGAPAGPIGAGLGGAGMAAAAYPPAKRFAASIDEMRGIQNPANQPKPLFGQAKGVASDFGEGLGMEAGGRAIGAGAEAAAPYVKPLFRGAAQKMANLGQTISGAPAKDLMTAYDQGLVKTYGAPSMKKAGSIFENAAQNAGAKSQPELESILDPQLTQARQTALEIGKKLQAGTQLTAQEALSARQAVDRIQASTPWKDRKTLKALGDLRGQFSDAVAKISPELQDASKTYRQAKVKNTLMKPMRINKNGDYSALLPILSTVGGALGSAATHSPDSLLATGAGVLGTSPLAAGVSAATSGDAVRAAGSMFSSPVGARTIASAVGNKVLDTAKAKEYMKKANGDKDKARDLAKADGWSF